MASTPQTPPAGDDVPRAGDGTPLSEYTPKYVNRFAEGTWFHNVMEERYRQNRDIIVIIDDENGERGSGKTTLALTLAAMMDQTEEGVTIEKCIIDPAQLGNAYSNLPDRSALILDEGEIGIDSRMTMTKTNKYVRQMAAIGRKRQKYLIINTPMKSMLDKDIRAMSAAWFMVTQRGKAIVHEMKNNPYNNSVEPFTPKKQWFGWEPIQPGTQLKKVYDRLAREKDKYIEGDRGESYITKSEHEQELKKVREKTENGARNETMANIYLHDEAQDDKPLSQRIVGEAVGLTQQQVGNIVREFDGTAEPE